MPTLNWDQLDLIEPGQFLWPPRQPLTEVPLVILVGLTGVGKSTALAQLAKIGVNFTLLPNRRTLTDKIIIAALQRAAGELPRIITDRLVRFEYTAQYRAKYPGGMAHALSRLAVDPTTIASPLIFDGLRGLEEVKQASLFFPYGRFILLDAPDTVRLNRLLHRADTFDAAEITLTGDGNNLLSALHSIPGIKTTFNQEQLDQIAYVSQTAQLAAAEVINKVSILVEERRNYDSQAARAYLVDNLPSDNILAVDTDAHPVSDVAHKIAAWLDGK